MEPRAHHVLIGLFALLSAAGALVFALWLNNSDGDRENSWYEIVFNQGVRGLSEGSPVKYSGIRVGDVAQLRLDSEDPRNVRALVRVFSQVPIRDNTQAILALENITGSMSIELKGGTPDSPILMSSRDDPPVIQAEPSALNSLVTSGELLLEKLDQVLTHSNRIMSDQNIDNLSRSLDNLRQLSSSLMAKREEVNTVFVRLNEITKQTRGVLDIFQNVGSRTESLLNHEVRALIVSATDATLTLEQSTSRIDQLLVRNQDALDQGMQSAGELAPALRDMRTTLNNLNGLIERLEEDPASLIRGKEPLQEFNP